MKWRRRRREGMMLTRSHGGVVVESCGGFMKQRCADYMPLHSSRHLITSRHLSGRAAKRFPGCRDRLPYAAQSYVIAVHRCERICSMREFSPSIHQAFVLPTSKRETAARAAMLCSRGGENRRTIGHADLCADENSGSSQITCHLVGAPGHQQYFTRFIRRYADDGISLAPKGGRFLLPRSSSMTDRRHVKTIITSSTPDDTRQRPTPPTVPASLIEETFYAGPVVKETAHHHPMLYASAPHHCVKSL